ncbi:hydroxylamine reductase, partial [Rhizobium sp. AAP43]|uniref:hydroxylamine reductase n=1 Tax=Rhizobium sp. AAP43 TaxID=1523420 RepID=UPI0012E206AF
MPTLAAMASRQAARSLRTLGSRLASSSLATGAARASPALLSRAFSAAAEPAPAKPIMENAMFCYQCEQTKNGTGCTTKGVCGKTPETTVLQDLLTYSVKGLSCWVHWAAAQGVQVPQEAYNFIQSATFACLTNVNFDDARFKEYVQESHRMVDAVEAACRAAGVDGAPPAPEGLPQFDLLAHPAQWRLDQGFLAGSSLSQLVALGQMTSLEHRRHKIDPTILGLQEMLTYGLRGLAAYTHHAAMLGQRSATVDKFIAEAYAFLCSPDASDVGKVLGMILRTGEVNLESMALLDGGHVAKFGHPEPSPVRLSPRKGKGILVSGHDMEDLRQLLDQTEGTGINVYTHGEMLPAHGYPGLKKYKHLAGNFGNSWWRQQKDFAEFPGPILMTTNCIIEPRPGYSKRIFTTGEVGWEGVSHIDGTVGEKKDFSALIKAAQEAPGFASEPEDQGEQPRTVTTGFARNAVLGVAGEVVKAV